METLRGGMLLLVRWLVDYPIVFCTYRLKNFTRAPFLMQPELQDKPGILVSNYGNFFFDDMIGAMVGPVWPYNFVRDSIYRLPLVGWVLKLFRAVPFIRSNDTHYTVEERRARNEKTFGKVADMLKRGHWFTIFPEVLPGHRSTLLTPFKPGAAHVGLRAEAESGWKLGLRIYVYGTNYENKFAGRSYCYIRWAPAIEVAKYRQLYLNNPAAAEQALMAEIEQAMHGVFLVAPNVAQLADAHRLAFQHKQANFPGVQQALSDVLSGKAGPEDLRRIVCKRVGESVTYQLLGYAVFSIGYVVAWPFRTFGRLCAANPAEEMTYQFVLWMMVLVTGTAFGESWHWAKIQIVDTWLASTVWLWAWRRGIVER